MHKFINFGNKSVWKSERPLNGIYSTFKEHWLLNYLEIYFKTSRTCQGVRIIFICDLRSTSTAYSKHLSKSVPLRLNFRKLSKLSQTREKFWFLYYFMWNKHTPDVEIWKVQIYRIFKTFYERLTIKENLRFHLKVSPL